MKEVSCCCNVLWFLFAGWYIGLGWCLLGLIWCITIIGIPFGVQAFKIGAFIFWPFGRDVREKPDSGACNCILNVFWFILGGFGLCITQALVGVIFCITIVGIPCGLQLFKLAQLSICPFGKEIVSEDELAQPQVNNITIVVPPNTQYTPPTYSK